MCDLISYIATSNESETKSWCLYEKYSGRDAVGVSVASTLSLTTALRLHLLQVS